MKLPLLFVLTFILLLDYSDSSWFLERPWSIVNSFTGKASSQLTSYVQEKGRNLKNTFNSYFGSHPNQSHPVEVGDMKEKVEPKIRNFVDKVVTDKNSIEIDTESEPYYSYEVEEDLTVQFSTPQLINVHGYPSESHKIVTADGYILTVHRIPYKKNTTSKSVPRKTVLLHHGLLGSSADWVIAGPNKGLAYILSDAGYDVWLANVRGNTYSRAHVSRSVDSYAFWNFTFHEVSQYDLPAVIDYIMEKKGWDVKINYIGHSMGTTVLFALLSTKTQYNKILRAGFALAPVAYMSNIKSPIRVMARYSKDIALVMNLFGANEFLPKRSFLNWLSKHAWDLNPYEEYICENSLFVLCGYDERQFNKSLLPLILSHTPAGASTKTFIHYAQEIKNNGKFQQFDYGSDGNLKQYGKINPPEYPLNEIKLPIALFSSENDWMASQVDATNLYVELQNPIEHYIVPFKEFNHIDFLWAVDAPTLVYAKLLQLMEEGVGRRISKHPAVEAKLMDDSNASII